MALHSSAEIRKWPLRTRTHGAPGSEYRCNFCTVEIKLTQRYYDGGNPERCYHEYCVDSMEKIGQGPTAGEIALHDILRGKQYE